MLKPVYDIKNCGPRHRYAANGKLIHNCDSVNLQNIPRKSKLKSAIVAPKGHVIVGADLSAIELRMGLSFAGQLDKMNMLGDGVDLYKDFAASIYGISVDEVTDSQRFMGKTSQLSLIYGTGAVKLRNQVKMMSGVDIGEVEAKRIVELYRSEYTSVVAAWQEGDRVLEAVVAWHDSDNR